MNKKHALLVSALIFTGLIQAKWVEVPGASDLDMAQFKVTNKDNIWANSRDSFYRWDGTKWSTPIKAPENTRLSGLTSFSVTPDGTLYLLSHYTPTKETTALFDKLGFAEYTKKLKNKEITAQYTQPLYEWNSNNNKWNIILDVGDKQILDFIALGQDHFLIQNNKGGLEEIYIRSAGNTESNSFKLAIKPFQLFFSHANIMFGLLPRIYDKTGKDISHLSLKEMAEQDSKTITNKVFLFKFENKIDKIWQELTEIPQTFKWLTVGNKENIWALFGEKKEDTQAYRWNWNKNKFELAGPQKGFEYISAGLDGTVWAVIDGKIYRWEEK